MKFVSALLVWLAATAAAAAQVATTPNDPHSADLYQAALDNDRDAMAVAMAAGGDINVRDNVSGQTALMAAVLRGKARAVEFLLKQGADTTIAEKDGYTPAHGAGFQGRAEVLRLLDKYGVNVMDPQPRHRDGFLPFHRACWGNEPRHTKVVRVYVEELGMDPKIKAKNGKTCFDMSPNSQTKFWLREREVEARYKEEF